MCLVKSCQADPALLGQSHPRTNAVVLADGQMLKCGLLLVVCVGVGGGKVCGVCGVVCVVRCAHVCSCLRVTGTVSTAVVR